MDIEQIGRLLWDDPERRAFAIVDGASAPNVIDRLYDDDSLEFECLFEGELEDDMAEVAPYLVALEPNSPMLDWMLKGWGAHWGMFAVSAAEFDDVWQHLRALTMVYSPQGAPMFFRYYDPRVLRVFASTCTAQELHKLFGPVDMYLMEDFQDPAFCVAISAGEDGPVERRLSLSRKA